MARAAGLPLAVVLVFDVSAGADCVLARPGVRSLAELAGKRVAVERSAVGELVYLRLLEAADLAPGALTMVPMTIDEQRAAWRAGSVDVAVTYQPTATRLESEGAVRLFDSRRLPGAILDVLAVLPAARRDAAAALRALIRAHFQARRHLLTYPQDAAHRMAAPLGLSVSELLQVYRGLELPDEQANHKLLTGSDPDLLATARMLSSVMVGGGLLPRPADLAGLVAPELLPEEVV